MAYDFDVIFIGSGHACWHGALPLIGAGKKVAIAEQEVTGGTCTNYGCNAKYLLDVPFDFADGMKNYLGRGVDAEPKVNWAELMAYKKQNIGPMGVGLKQMFTQMGVAYLDGHAQLTDAHTVEVAGKAYTTDCIVLGTGEHPRIHDIEGADLLHDSREFLDVEDFPKRVAFLGAGIISFEFASIAAKLGSETYLIHHNDRALRAFPEAYVDTIVAKLEGEGVHFVWNDDVEKAEAVDGGVKLTLKSGSELEVDYVLDGIGRTPNVEGLGLAEAGVDYSARGIKVDDHLRTSVSNIYASGDCIDKRIPKLTPTAEFESNYIASQILGNPNPIEYPVVPHLVFTLPRIAQCGVSVDAAKADTEHYRVVEVPYGKAIAFMAKSDEDMSFTYVFDNATGALVGAAILGQDAGELINVIALIINAKLTRADLQQMIFTFPGTTYGMLSYLIPQMA